MIRARLGRKRIYELRRDDHRVSREGNFRRNTSIAKNHEPRTTNQNLFHNHALTEQEWNRTSVPRGHTPSGHEI
jgi:hypothetical protein